ncbi:uncharacterized protein [Triticum aestivum]|uniref:uncharacterized protein n=1 Tax=Triticum aestivum TaxID=4565 RepID=UPI001D01E950|nr:uncharacterized protein LOC123134577 [Triticum aestivum]
MDFYHVQPHHLTPNTVTLLSAFVMVCEGYIGILPTIKLWGAFFYGKLGTSSKDTMAECGGFVAVHRPAKRNVFPVIKLSQSVKLRQQSYFYVENVDLNVDFINLPAYEASPPVGSRSNWGYKPKPVSADTTAAIGRLRVLQESEGLVASDLLIAFVERRVLPLQGRPHMICRMGGHRNPCRLCTKDMPIAEVGRMVNEISDLKVSEGDWRYGKRPYSRDNPPPAVSPLTSFRSSDSWSCTWCNATLLSGVQIYMSVATTAIVGPGGDYLPDWAVSDVDDPDLGVAALEEDTVGDEGAGSSEEGGGMETWPNDDDDEDEPRPPRSTANTGADPSTGPPARGGKHKRKQGAALFGSAPKKPKNPAAATKRREAAAKVAKFQRQPKVPLMVSS